MAKEKIAPGAKRGGSFSKFATWGIMALLFLGLIGFGAGSFGAGGGRIATVEGEVIEVNDFVRAIDAVRRAPDGTLRSSDEAQAIALGQLVGDAAMTAEARRLGLAVGDERLREAIVTDPNFAGLLPGSFDRESYREGLRRIGMSAAEYESRLRVALAADLVRRAVIGVPEAPEPFVDLLRGYLLEERDITWAALEPELLETPVEDPADDVLAEWFEENAAAFTIPEAKEIAYLWLSPEGVARTLPVDEDALAALYEDRADQFRRPERRLAERVVFPDVEAAEAAAAQIEDGDSTLADEADTLGQEVEDLGAVSRDELGDAADAVFDAGIGDTGVVETPDGPAIFRVNAVLNPLDIPLEDVRDELALELALEDAEGAIDRIEDEVADLLAGGATIEDVALEVEGAETGTLFYHPAADDPLLSYAAIRSAAAAIDEDDFADALRTDDGGLFALRMDGVREARVPELDEVREDALSVWRTEAETEALRALAETLLPAFEGGEDLPFEPRVAEGITREGGAPGAPQTVLLAAFEAAEGEARVVPTPLGAALLRVDAVRPAAEDATSSMLDAQGGLIAQQYATDLVAAYARALQAGMDVRIDQQMLNAVRSQYGN